MRRWEYRNYGDKWKEMKPEIEINSDNIFLSEREANRETGLRMSRFDTEGI
jgi:hypothetical protein